MKSQRFFFVMVGCLGVSVLLIIGAVVGGDMLFKMQAKKLGDLKVQSKVIEDQEKALVQAKKDIQQYSDLDQIAKSVVPQDKDQAKTVREITSIAADAGVNLKSITFPTSTLGQATTPTPAAAGTSSSTTPAKPKAQPPPSQTTAVEGIPGVYALPITVSSPDNAPVPYHTFITLLEKLENNRRTAHVEKISITPSVDRQGNSVVVFQLTLNAYVKP
jgi:hypothetical protein